MKTILGIAIFAFFTNEPALDGTMDKADFDQNGKIEAAEVQKAIEMYYGGSAYFTDSDITYIIDHFFNTSGHK